MVLFKRKPVQYVSPPTVDDGTEVWVIENTDEIFTSFEAYTQRMEFYNQKRFICEITGHSSLTFFDALMSEMDASEEVRDAFPDPLREPILRKVQFSTISRIDSLVDHIFDEFKNDFFPGEHVIVIMIHERLNGILREKTKFPDIFTPRGDMLRKAFARYFVTLTDREDHEALVDEEHIVRDRKSFTKQMLRSFLKNSVSREAWTGAPWLVKEKIANEYRINTEVPMHLRYEHQVAQRKTALNTKKGEHDGTLLSFFSTNVGRLPELKPKSHKSKSLQQDAAKARHEQFLEYQRALSGNPMFQFDNDGPQTTQDQLIQFINQHPDYPHTAAKGMPKQPPPPTIKYPIEDLELPPSRELDLHRPHFKMLPYEHVGPVLETWNTLNVFCEVFQLDSFTFDDYVDALVYQAENGYCELLVEIHCALLKKLVNDENDVDGQVQVNLPHVEEESEEDEVSPATSSLPTPEPENKPARTTRSSLAKSEAAEVKMTQDEKLHRGAEIDQSVRGSDWISRLRKRDFRNGKWIVIIVGLLNLLSLKPRLQKACVEILIDLAPLDMEATEETAISEYATLDLIHRVSILQILCTLSLETRAIRGYMEDCAIQMTEHRKEKIEQQRARKVAMEELRLLHEERKILQPEDTSPVPELDELEDLKMEDPEEDEHEQEGDVVVDSEDEEPVKGRSLRRANDRAAERRRKIEEEKERKEKAEAEKAKKPTKQARQFEKVLKKIEEAKDKIRDCEEEIAVIDNDLREADCPRTKVLGKDRFWNRYYWMERNAMPYAGLPDSSTASAGYANGCIWVQGPDDLERQGFIELSDAENAQYRRAFDMSVPERKMREEGHTHLYFATQWGYYDSPEELDQLITWLDVRGVREIKLRKELTAQREKIVTYMEKRKQYLSEDKKLETVEPTTRISTRTKTYVDQTGHRCLAWRNNTALEELGHIHSEPNRARKQQQAKTRKKAKEEDEGRQTRASNRAPKLPTRQGGRYNF